jgi:hypothetical protein
MNKARNIGLAVFAVALLVGGIVRAGDLTTALTQKQVRDPRQLETILEDNFSIIDAGTNTYTGGKTVKSTDSQASLERIYFRLESGNDSQTESSNDVYSTVYLFKQYNDAGGATTAAVDFAKIVTTASDVTGSTEDSKIEISVKVNGSYQEAIQLDSSGAIINGAVDADNVTVDADAGVDCQAAGTLELGAATADKVEVADASVETEIQGPLDVHEAADFDNTFTLSASALNVTNGQAITVSAGAYVLNGIGGADNSTNTVTLVAPAAAGELVYLMVATASSNLVAIADSGTVAASGGIELDGNDTAVLMGVDTSTWCLISESDN